MTEVPEELVFLLWQAAGRAALKAAAELIEPRNPRDDWTEYARIRGEAADAIRALAKE
jgi:hypothetical protein